VCFLFSHKHCEQTLNYARGGETCGLQFLELSNLASGSTLYLRPYLGFCNYSVREEDCTSGRPNQGGNCGTRPLTPGKQHRAVQELPGPLEVVTVPSVVLLLEGAYGQQQQHGDNQALFSFPNLCCKRRLLPLYPADL